MVTGSGRGDNPMYWIFEGFPFNIVWVGNIMTVFFCWWEMTHPWSFVGAFCQGFLVCPSFFPVLFCWWRLCGTLLSGDLFRCFSWWSCLFFIPKMIHHAIKPVVRCFFSHGWLAGGFKQFLFSPLPGEMIQLDQFFSTGLKPPTRLVFEISTSVFRALEIKRPVVVMEKP